MPKSIPFLHLAVDIVLFNIIDNQLHILLIKRKNIPYEWYFCLPGGFVSNEETVEQTVIKVLYRETGIFCDHVKLFGSFSKPNRDPRGRIVSLGYYSIISNNSIQTKPWITQLSAWFYSFREVGVLGFDHNDVLTVAYNQLQEDVQNSDIVKYFLPKYFTIDQLKSSCEVIYNRKFEKRNFIKYIESHFKIQKTNKKELYVNHRPAAFYKFINR